jgi:hypothetical protein
MEQTICIVYSRWRHHALIALHANTSVSAIDALPCFSFQSRELIKSFTLLTKRTCLQLQKMQLRKLLWDGRMYA